MGITPSKGFTMSIESVLWSVLGILALVGGVGLVASILALIKAPKS